MSVMKVITFYSYKGGQGRTMALASIASLLYRLGKNVVILDLDFEAPGVLAKFAPSVFTDLRATKSGVIQCFSEFESEMMVTGRMATERMVIKDISPFLTEVAPRGTEGATGQLRLIPTGYPCGGDYFDATSDKKWTNLFYPSPVNEVFFDEMYAAIRHITPEPNYLLVDIKAGVSQSGTINMKRADAIICLFSSDFESQHGMRYALKLLDSMHRVRLDGAQTIILPVLSRIPHFLTKEEKSGLRNNFSNKLEENLRVRFSRDNIFSVWPKTLKPLVWLC